MKADICVIGAGPVGLFAVFEAGLQKMRCHVIDSLDKVGGQLTEIYPDKPIYDIPGHPEISGKRLIDNLLQQIAPFEPFFTLGERVEHLSRTEDGSFVLLTSARTEIHAKVVVIAGGLGSFEPRKPAIDELSFFEGKGVDYYIKDPEKFRGKDVVLAGGGDAALDWTIHLMDIAAKVTLVHRGDTFRAVPASVSKVFIEAANGRLQLFLKSQVTGLSGMHKLEQVSLTMHDCRKMNINADYFIPLFGMTPRLGPLATWGIDIEKNAIPVSTLDYSTNVEGVYAIGDINTYPGKLKLILCGFHEAALMIQSAFRYIYPDQKPSFKYTTVYGINNF